MEMGLRVLGLRTPSRIGRFTNFVLLVSGGVLGGTIAASLLSLGGTLSQLSRFDLYVMTVMMILVTFITIRYPTREWGIHRQVDRGASFGVTQSRPRTFLWGLELGSGVATVITQTSTLAILIIALLSPIQEAVMVGAIYGGARLLRTWRGSFPRPGAPFSDAMHRHDQHPRRTARLNASAVIVLTIWLAALSVTTLIH